MYFWVIIFVSCVLLVMSQALFSRPQVLSPQVDWQQIKSTRPNQYLVCPPQHCHQADAQSPAFNLAIGQLKHAWTTVINQQANTELATIDAATHTYRYIQRSRVFRFPDVITVQFIALGSGQTTLAIHSGALLGYYDFGVNRRRVKTWLKLLKNGVHEIEHAQTN
jgi:uncharacterized protein (DUF1499 family)